MVDGLSAVEARVAEIQAVFTAMQGGPATIAGSVNAGRATPGPEAGAGVSFASVLQAVQGDQGPTGTAAAGAGTSSEISTPVGGQSLGTVSAGPSGQVSEQLIAAAKSWIGTPYVYGGTSKAGVDCSGFTQGVYQSLGVNIGRDTSAQFKSGQRVGLDGNWQADVGQLQPGDLIFYGEPGASGPNAHVVMYIGNGQIIQAAHSGTNVAVGPLFDAASSDEPFLGIRRYVTATSPSGVSSPTGQQLGAIGQSTDVNGAASDQLLRYVTALYAD